MKVSPGAPDRAPLVVDALAVAGIRFALAGAMAAATAYSILPGIGVSSAPASRQLRLPGKCIDVEGKSP